MKTVFMYAGQGSQFVSMGMDFYNKYESYKKFIDSVKLSKDYKKLMHEGPLEDLSLTENTQPAMAMFAIGVTKLLEENNIKPDMAVGLSLGEYGALYAAGVISEEDYLKVIEYRGNKMAEAASKQECAMSAIIGMDVSDVEKAVEEISKKDIGYITIANYNCPKQYVICGDLDAVEETEKLLKEMGARRIVRLNVSGPFHTKYMHEAKVALEELFKKVTFKAPTFPVAVNYTGKIIDNSASGEEIKELLTNQVQSSVRFEKDVEELIKQGADNFIEIGPGKVLSGFVRKKAKEMNVDVKVTSISKIEDLEAIVA
ncbi:ACP S-malonyltransferase [Lachnobacterium bovis]|uniref:Malonyl CoA-acyl carrier protein transacylase n=1 Tax=Lachnobacterium bovis DSM 14045 TaxID=1122142 RepID=A0A1H3I7R5_9FIRM|nr:ACP S-malonyltransferase [Lachnobacterium bovis]SDY22984.1 [acyl-carrier-protein] S-malonyltransferase [Lachnobacterium bovis DSM 14045]